MAWRSSRSRASSLFNRSQRLLDVGAGPGLLGIGGEVVGVDPEPAMVAAARSAALRAGVSVKFAEGRFEDLAAGLRAIDVVTIGRAIHWLDPDSAPMALDRIANPLGGILVCHASSVDDGRNVRLGAFNAIRYRWRDDRPRYDPDIFFAGGPFVSRKTIGVEKAVNLNLDRLSDRILSTSTSSPEWTGDGWHDRGHRRGAGGGVRARLPAIKRRCCRDPYSPSYAPHTVSRRRTSSSFMDSRVPANMTTARSTTAWSSAVSRAHSKILLDHQDRHLSPTAQMDERAADP
jgi:hypothetical protein